MSDRIVKSSIAALAILVGLTQVPAGNAQAAPTPAKPSTTKTAPPVKPAPAKVTPAPAVKPTPTRAIPAPVAPTTSLPPNVPRAVPSTVQTVPNGRPVISSVAGGGRGAVKSSAVSTVGAATVAVPGRPPIPSATQVQRSSIPASAGRAPIPVPGSSGLVPAASRSYITSPSSGRSPIPSISGSGSGSGAGGGTSQAVASQGGALGTVQWGQGMLTVYGCGRQGAQVVCDTDFNNQNQNQTHVEINWWRDAYLVDQFGDRHNRGSAYFVNGEGLPRESIEIPYGQSARYIFVFNDVSPNVAQVSLHSPYGPLDIENIGLDTAAVANGNQAADASGQANADPNSVAGTAQSLKNTGKQRAADAQKKAVGTGQDAVQKLLDKVPH